MLQLLRGLKQPTKTLAINLFNRLLSSLRYVTKHPIKTIKNILKAYLLLVLLAFCVSFLFAGMANASPDFCPDGGTYQNHPELGHICSVSAPFGQSARVYKKDNSYIEGSWPSVAETAVETWNTTEYWPWNGTTVTDTVTNPNIPSEPKNFNITVERRLSDGLNPDSVSTITFNVTASALPPRHYCPPDGSPKLLNFGGTAPHEFCWAPAQEIPECDCSDFRGKDITGSMGERPGSLLSPSGTFTQQTPPQCVTTKQDIVGSDTPLTCTCQVSAKKWIATTGPTIDGINYDRWETLPYEQGKPSGTFTGVQCGKDTQIPDQDPEDAPEDCFVTQNGLKWCWANEDEKCARVNGVLTCEPGCGTVNGDFVCVDTETPLPGDEEPPVDDTVDDPTKPTSDMTKQDYKDVNRGVESRLDILNSAITKVNTTNNQNGAKIDATNKLLAEISGKIDDLGGGSGDGDFDMPDGTEDGAGGIGYDTDRLSEFTNANDWEQKNFGTVMLAASQQLQETPIFTSVSGFFDVSLSGSCPIWSTSFTVFEQSFNFTVDQQCSEVMTQIWPIIRAIIILIFSFLAFRVAIL